MPWRRAKIWGVYLAMKKTQQKKKFWVMGARLRSLLMVLLGSAIIATAFLLGTYVLRISQVEVSGDVSVSADEVAALLNIQEGDTLLSYTEEEVRNRLLSNPYLSLERMERKWPSRLTLHLVEREPVAGVSYGGGYVLIDKEGIVLETIDNVDGMLTAVNVSPTAAMVGNVIQGLDDYQIKVIGEISEKLQASIMWDEFTTIDVSQPACVVLGTKTNIKVRFGMAEEFETKIAMIDKLLPSVIEEGMNFGTVDVSLAQAGASYIPHD